eukprot:Gb_19042 [translate_table: standard]
MSCKLIFLYILALTEVLFQGSSQARLHDSDLAALNDISHGLHDLPGSVFFKSWDFSRDPCTSFSGVICEQTDGVLRVQVLNLGTGLANSPGLTGKLSPSLGNLTGLLEFIVYPGRVRGSIPKSLGNLHKLEFLAISKNWLSGPIPSTLSNLQSLHTLDFSYNQLHGSIPAGLTTRPDLKVLVLAHNDLVGAIPAIESRLIHLDLSQNLLSGHLPQLPSSLHFLSVAQNILSGSVENVDSLMGLKYLDLSLNQFTGSIPASIFAMQLSNLLLERNSLSGSLTIHGPVSIETMDLSHDNLSGELSPLLASAQNIYLNHNHFTGTIPLEYVRKLYMGSIQTLYLHHNYFSAFPLASGAPLPSSGSLCIQYNCMDPPVKSPCPLSSGGKETRPTYECDIFDRK